MRKIKKKIAKYCLLLVVVLVMQVVHIMPVYAAEKYYWPTPSVLTLSRGYSSGHKGLDIAAPLGTDIYATKSGTVIGIGNACTCQKNLGCEHKLYFGGDWIQGIGSGVVIKHDDGSGYSTYAHMTADSWPSEMSIGTKVVQGQFIGKTGQSGVSTGPHLHFDLMDNSSVNRWKCNTINNNKEVIDYVYSYNGIGLETENTLVKNTGVTNITDTTAKINATISPGATVTEVGFYLGTSKDNMTQKKEIGTTFVEYIWYDLGTGKWSGALTRGTTYYYQIYAIIGGTTYTTSVDSFKTTGDGEPPQFDNVYITDVDAFGYTVVCEATDNLGIDRVCFPTWTDANGQDDLVADWYNNAAVFPTYGSNTYLYRVNIANHNGERGNYTTHVYAYDVSGNSMYTDLYVNVPLNVPFNDVNSSNWYYAAVADVYEKGYMSGKGDRIFDPEGNLTRAEVATILYSVEGKPYTTYINSFPDVPDGQWYSNAISWAFRNGVVSGYDNGLYGTMDNVTREQLAVMLYGYARSKNANVSYADTALNGFNDQGQISDYAVTAMKWAVSNGMLSGKAGGLLDPKGQTTRGECAVIISKFTQNILN